MAFFKELLMMRRFFSILFLLVLLAGCGPRNPLGRQAIAGRVTLDGEPLDQGTVGFSPTAAHGVTSGAMVQNGRFAISAQKGLPPGKYVVRINSAKAAMTKNPDAPPGAGIAPGIERIAPVYNDASTVTIDVVAGRPADFQFDAKSK
jgi:hypothetical protein